MGESEREREVLAAEVEMSFGRRNEDMERERMGGNIDEWWFLRIWC